MSQPAQAAAPGNPAAQGIAQAAIKSLVPGLGGAGGIPGFQSTATSSAKSGDIWSTFGLNQDYDGSGFTVNYGSGVMQGGGVSWVLIAAVAAAGYFLWKKRST